MKHIKKRWLGLAISPALIALIGFASPANAADYSGDCAGISAFNGTGNVTINNTGACSLPNALTATGYIHITSSGAITAVDLNAGGTLVINGSNSIEVGALTSGDYLDVRGDGDVTTDELNAESVIFIRSTAKLETADVTSGANSYIDLQADNDIKTEKLTSGNNGYIHINSTGGKIDSKDITAPAATIWLEADKEIAAGSLKTSAGDQTGAIQIDANKGGDSSLFTIGGSGHTNGINGTVDTTSSLGGGTLDNFIHGGLRVTNGTSGSSGGITVNSMSDIAVISSASRSGIIILDAQNGTLTLPAGSLNADGSGSGAGVIELRANTLATSSGTIITANQGSAAAGTYHGVTVAANTVTLTGAGTELHANGNGVSQTLRGFVNLVPRNALVLQADNTNPNAPYWTSTIQSNNTPISITGEGAPFKATANGNNSIVKLAGLPVTFSNGAVTLESKGATDHQVEIIYTGGFSGVDGLIFANDGDVSIDVSGVSGPGGKLTIEVDNMTVASSGFVVNADAADDGNYSGGIVRIASTELNMAETVYTSKISANAHGTGYSSVNGIAVNIGIGEVHFEKLSAKGRTIDVDIPTIDVFGSTGSKLTINESVITSVPGSEGVAGTIRLQADDIVFDGLTTVSPTIEASSGSSVGEGGWIILVGKESISVAADNTHFSANGKDKGGRINIETEGDFGAANGIGTISMEANGLGAAEDGSSDGGEIKIVAGGSVDLYGGAVSVAAGPTGGKGGKLEIEGTQINIDGDLAAIGSITDGDGGEITLDSTTGQLTMAANSTITATGQNAGTGGKIVLTGNTLDLGIGTIDASAGHSGSIDRDTLPVSISIEATSIITATTLPDGLSILANGGSDGTTKSGQINITTAGPLVVDASVNTDNSSSGGRAGQINLDTSTTLTINGTVSASATDSAGVAGAIEMKYIDATGGTTPITIGSTGIVKADQLVIEPVDENDRGAIFIINKVNDKNGVFVNGLLSSENGYVAVEPPSREDFQMSGAGTVVGSVFVENIYDVVINMAQGSITIGSIDSIGKVQIMTASGYDIISKSGVGNTAITAEELTFDSGGQIFSSDSEDGLFPVSVETLTVTANESASGEAYIRNENVGSENLILKTSDVSGTFRLDTNNSLTLNSINVGFDSGLTRHPGNLEIMAGGETIDITSFSNINAWGGSVFINGNGGTKLAVKAHSNITAYGYSDSEIVVPGRLDLSMGPSVGNTVPWDGTGEPNFTLIGTGQPEVGLSFFTATASGNTATVGVSGMTIYGPSVDSITFEGSVSLWSY